MGGGNYMKTLKHYNGSQDWKTLYSLVKEQDVICIVQPYLDEDSDREVIVRASYNEQGDFVEVGTLGVSYFMAKSLEKFEQMCKKYNLSYLKPNNTYLVIDFENDIWQCETLEQAKKEANRYNSAGLVDVYEARRLEEYELI